MAVHLYVGDDPGPWLHGGGVYCGWPHRVHLRHTTWDWREVTCMNCLGRRAGATRFAEDQVKAERAAAPQGDGDPRPLGDDAA